MRYKAPDHTSEIFLSTGPLRVDDEGYVNAPDDLPHADVTALCANGFAPVPEKAAKAEKPAKEA